MNLKNSIRKVTLVTRHFSTLGGLEKYGMRIAKAFASKGLEVNILTSDPVIKSSLHPLIHLHSLPTKKWLNFRKLREYDHLCKMWLQTAQSDIIFGMDRTRYQTHLRAGNGLHAAYLKQRQLIKPYHPSLNPLNQEILKIEKAALESPELKILFTNSHMVKKEILSYYKTAPEKIQVVHNGVEWKEMQQDFASAIKNKQTICKELGLDPALYHFLFIGNGYKRKGLALLLKALSLLPERDFHLSVLGKDKKAQSYITLANRLGLKDHVSFFGMRSDTRRFYQVCDALVIPSFYDPFANVTVEALAMGLYVVSSRFNGGYEVLSDENGTVIEDLLSPEAFTHSLAKALTRPKTEANSQAIRNSVKHLDFSNQLSIIIDATLDS